MRWNFNYQLHQIIPVAGIILHSKKLECERRVFLPNFSFPFSRRSSRCHTNFRCSRKELSKRRSELLKQEYKRLIVLVAIFDNFDTKFQNVEKEISRNYYFSRVMRKSSSSTLFSPFTFLAFLFKMEEETSAKEKSFAWAQVEGAQKSESRGNYGRVGVAKSSGLTVRLKGKRKSLSLSLCFEKPEEVGGRLKKAVCRVFLRNCNRIPVPGSASKQKKQASPRAFFILLVSPPS